MSTPQTHPRRRPFKATSPQVTPQRTHIMHLRKSGSYSPPTPISSDYCGLANADCMPPRSPTNDSLQRLVEDPSVPAHVLRILANYDLTVAGNKSSNSSSILHDPEVLPVPKSFVRQTEMDTTPMDIDSKPSTVQRNPHDHASDSGLGSSISGSKYGDTRSHQSISTSVTSSHGAITRSFSALGASDDKHTLGEYACKQIHDHIIKPILAEESLQDFHPLINDVPRRIGEKNITNLRDLEKTLIFLAPEFSASPKSYLNFCETSIRLLHVTVDNLSEQDQRLPSDRPYTNNYFLDLIEQIRRYAAIMAATRQKEVKGEQLDEMDYTPDEKITLRGGLSHNGCPAELVREKNSKVIPLDKNISSQDAYKGISSFKRTLSDADMDDEDVARSMARRRKSDKPGDVMHVCRDCKKDFKRPCDLTKHEKTHSRPWKCTEDKCKYFNLGWPTEKERDRHVNDKHSAIPPQYKCLYPPCTYASKRESNCKQHMEKAHGWEYVRSKNNGRKKGPTSAGSERSPPTPLMSYDGTPQSAALGTPLTPLVPSPSIPMYSYGTPALSINGFPDGFRRDSVTTDGSVLTYSSGYSPVEPNSFEEAVSPEDNIFNHSDTSYCNNFATNFNTFQQLTPAMSAEYDIEHLNLNMNTSNAGGFPHLSPGARPDVTLFSPSLHLDEGFGDEMAAFHPPSGDFTLFETTQGGNIGFNATDGFFDTMPDMNQMGGQFDQHSDLYADPPMAAFDDIIFGTLQ